MQEEKLEWTDIRARITLAKKYLSMARDQMVEAETLYHKLETQREKEIKNVPTSIHNKK